MVFRSQSAAMPSQACWELPPAWDVDRLLRQDDLPLDPRSWRRSDVARWVALHGGLPERFPMNGKALCLMTREMFVARVPARGENLHHDFRRRLAKALALQELIENMTSHSKP